MLLHNLKCVYRSQAGKIQTLFKEIERFVKSLDSVGNTFTWIAQLEHGLGNLSIDQIMHEIYQWQVAKNSCTFSCRIQQSIGDIKVCMVVLPRNKR